MNFHSARLYETNYLAVIVGVMVIASAIVIGVTVDNPFERWKPAHVTRTAGTATYTVDGHTYPVRFSNIRKSYKRYTTVYYNPENPSENSYKRPLSDLEAVAIVMGGIGMIVICLGFGIGSTVLVRQRQLITPEQACRPAPRVSRPSPE